MSSDATHPSEEHSDPRTPRSEDEILSERRRIALAALDEFSFSGFHMKICLVAGAGFFTDAYDLFAIAIVAEMLGILYGTNVPGNISVLTQWQSAGLKLATSIGNVIGQLLFGWLGDMLGRKRMYGVELVIIIIATFGQTISGQGYGLNIISVLIFWRVILGIGVGGDYPMSAIITSEFASTKIRGCLMTAVFFFQGWGQLVAALVSLVVVAAFKDGIEASPNNVDSVWRLIIGLGSIPAVIALYLRLTVPETPRFTMDIERNVEQAARDIANVRANNNYGVYMDGGINGPRAADPRKFKSDFVAHFSKWKNLKVLIGTAYSWFVLDIVFYILTLDGPNILSDVNFTRQDDGIYPYLMSFCVGNVILVAAGYVPGFFASLCFIDVWGRKPIQLVGFAVLTILFWIMGFGYTSYFSKNSKAFLALYCIANFFQNFGPNTTTFVIPGEVFPTRYRSTAHGISAASGKLGATVAQIVFAATSNRDSNSSNKLGLLLQVLSFVMMTGIFSTLLIPETMNRTLESISNEGQEAHRMAVLGPRPESTSQVKEEEEQVQVQAQVQ